MKITEPGTYKAIWYGDDPSDDVQEEIVEIDYDPFYQLKVVDQYGYPTISLREFDEYEGPL